MARILIKNGTVVSPTGRHDQDVLIDGEVIVALYARGQADAMGVTADKVIDAGCSRRQMYSDKPRL
ncbi:MAG: hypothetical protein EBY86_05520, partial [Acidimicrobiia bacterium]|nr:hypothetical protein [Acidimicrobiia bacterium]